MHDTFQENFWVRSTDLLMGVIFTFGIAVFGGTSQAENHASAVLEQFCLDCHDQETQKGEVNLEKALATQPLVRHLPLWRTVIARIENGDMPPREKGTLPELEKRKLLKWLDQEITHFDYDTIDDPGYEPARRMTHHELVHTLRDLLGVSLNVRDSFPTDLSGESGFDNSANTLFIQPILMERYLAAIEKAIEQAIPLGHSPGSDSIFSTHWPSHPHEEQQAASAMLANFLPKAFRRPVTENEFEEIFRLYGESRKRGENFTQGMRQALTGSLIAPQFLLKVEHHPPTHDAYPVGSYELATRLSYFLWASMPDAELFNLAAQEQLTSPEVIEKQLTRMLQDPKAETLGSLFAAQWLGFDALGTRIRMDPIDNPWCTDSLMQAMKEESAMNFLALLRENQPLTEFIQSRTTYLNEELATFYEIDSIKGQEMRRVTLSDPRRYGLFGQASVLAVTSSPYQTSPIRRGEWVLNALLGTPPAPPPPDAGTLSEAIESNQKLSFREKLQRHSQDPRCQSCHREMDPIGFALENFDWFGRWRLESNGHPIDAKGRLPSGTRFEGPVGLRNVIIHEKLDDLARQITRKMLSYALGRQLEYFDEPAVRTILRAFKSKGYRMHTLIQQICLSYPFLYKRDPIPAERQEGPLAPGS